MFLSFWAINWWHNYRSCCCGAVRYERGAQLARSQRARPIAGAVSADTNCICAHMHTTHRPFDSTRPRLDTAYQAYRTERTCQNGLVSICITRRSLHLRPEWHIVATTSSFVRVQLKHPTVEPSRFTGKRGTSSAPSTNSIPDAPTTGGRTCRSAPRAASALCAPRWGGSTGGCWPRSA